MSEPQISIIVVSYNTREMTLACLKSVYAETTVPFELIVVDNASTDGSAEAIAEAFPPDAYTNFKFIAETTNHGFAPAHDIALPHARAPWLLLLNPDTVVLDRAIDNLLEHAKQTPEAGIWGGRTLYADKSLNPFSCWGRMTVLSLVSRLLFLSSAFPKSPLFNSEEIGGWDRADAREVDIVVGCLFLMRREDWDTLGGFDADFTMYGEEADLCLRARAMGMRPRITPDATIIHYGGASETVQADKMVRIMRAKMELIKRHFSPATRGLGRTLFALWPLSRALMWRVFSMAGKAGAAKKAATWQEIWQRRKEWSDGYSA